jgi:hypothetical protein
MMPGTPELCEAVEERARLTDNAPLALLALHLRAGSDDFACDALVLLDIISTAAERFRSLEPLAASAIENESPQTSVLVAEDLVRALEFQLSFARRLVEFLQADVERGKPAPAAGDAGGAG